MAVLLLVATAAGLPGAVRAWPTLVQGCAHPTTGLSLHQAPVVDAAVAFAPTKSGTTVASFESGATYNVCVSGGGQMMLTATAGSFGGSSMCDGRRVNAGWAVDCHDWTAPATTGSVTFQATRSSGRLQAYRPAFFHS